MVSGTLQEIQGTLQQIEGQLLELNLVKSNLDAFGRQKAGSQILAPISNGIFVSGELKDNARLIVNVGSNVAVKKTIPETKGLLDERMHELEDYRADLMANLERVAGRAQQLESELMAIMPKE